MHDVPKEPKQVPALKLASAVEQVEELDWSLRRLAAELFGEGFEGAPDTTGWHPCLSESVEVGADRLFEAKARCEEAIARIRGRLL